MGSGGKKKTTMAKLARENRLRERRLIKQAKRDARKEASSDHLEMGERPPEADGMAESASQALPEGVPPTVQPATTNGREDGAAEATPDPTRHDLPIDLEPFAGDDPSDGRPTVAT